MRIRTDGQPIPPDKWAHMLDLSIEATIFRRGTAWSLVDGLALHHGVPVGYVTTLVRDLAQWRLVEEFTNGAGQVVAVRSTSPDVDDKR